MQVKIDAKELQSLKVFSGLYKSCRLSTNPIFQYLLIEIGLTKVRFSLTDLDVSLTVFLPFEALPSEGSENRQKKFLLPYKDLLDYVKTQKGTVTITREPQGIQVNDAWFGNADLPDEEEYPDIPVPPNEMPWSISGDEFRKGLKFCSPYICRDAERFVLNGVFFELPCKGEYPFRTEETVARLVATDGHQLGLTEIPFEGPEEEVKVIIPALTCDLLSRLPGEKISFALVEEGKKQRIFFRGEGWVLSAVPIESTYPDYRAIVNHCKGARYIFDANEMYRALTELKPLASTSSGRRVYRVVELKMSKTKIDLVVNDGKATKSVQAEGTYEFGFSFKVNLDYFLNALGKRTGRVITSLYNLDRPVVFQFGNEPRQLVLVMPITPENGVTPPDPPKEVLEELLNVEALERFRVPEQKKSRSRTRSRARSRECATCKKLLEENKRLKEQIEFLQFQLQKVHFELESEGRNVEAHATEAELLRERIAELEAENESLLRALKEMKKRKQELDEIRTRQERELQLIREELRGLAEQRNKERPMIPLQCLPEGGAVASIDGMVVYFRDGRILRPNGNGGEPVGRYDRLLGLGKIGDRVVHLTPAVGKAERRISPPAWGSSLFRSPSAAQNYKGYKGGRKMLVKHLCLTCKNKSYCPIAGAVIDEHATELVEEIAEPWWHGWEVRVVITTCERYEDKYTTPDAHLEAAYEDRFELYE